MDPIISTFARSPLSFPNVVCFIRPKLPLFSCPPTLFLQGLRFLNHVSILWMWIFSILFHQCSYLVILRKMLRSFIGGNSCSSSSTSTDIWFEIGISYRVFILDPYLVDLFLYLNSKWLLNLRICDHFKWNAFVLMFGCEDYMLQFQPAWFSFYFVCQCANGCHPLQDGSR